VACGFSIGVQNDGVTAAITDGRPVASIQNEAPTLMLGDKLLDRFMDLWRDALVPWLAHGRFLSF